MTTQSTITNPARMFLTLVIVSVIVRLIYLILLSQYVGAVQFSDFLYMHQLASALSAGEGFTIDGVRIFNQSVGYPAFLSVFYALFGTSLWVAMAVNAALGGIAVGLVYIVSAKLIDTWSSYDRGRIALAAAVVAVIYPDAWMYSALAASENLLIPLFLGLILINTPRRRETVILESRRNALFSGLTTGFLAAAMLTVKANMIFYLPFIVLTWMYFRQRWFLRGIGAVVCGTLILTPWTVLNYRASGGEFIPFAAVAGTVFLDGTNPAATGKPTNQYRVDIENDGALTEVELDRLRMRKAVSYIRASPAWYASLLARKLMHGISPARDFVYEHEGSYRLFNPVVSRWYPTFFNIFLLSGVAFGLGAAARQREPRLILLGVALCGSALLMQMVFCAYSRYRYPFLYALIPHAVFGWTACVRHIARAIRGRGNPATRPGGTGSTPSAVL